MRRIGGHVSTSGGLNNAIKNTLEIGGNCMQIFAGSPRMWKRSLYPQSVATGFKEQVAKHDLSPVFIHALYLTNLASDNPELVEKTKSAIMTDLENSALIDSAGVILHIGSHQGRGWEASRDQVIKEIKDILASTPEESILILENSAGQNGKIGSLQELGEILTAINSPRLKICLDTAHAFEAGYNFASSQGLEMWIKEIAQFLGWDKLVCLHLNDSKTKLGSGHDQHANIGEGFIGSEGLSRLINHDKLKHLPLLLEVPGEDKSGPDQENIQRVQELLQ